MQCVFRPDHAVDDVHSGAFELFGPLHVGRLVEAGLELDQHGHLHTPLGGADQAADDRAVAAGAVQRHLDALHARVVGDLGDERLDAAGVALVGVVQEQRPIAHDRHDRSIGLLGDGDAAGGDRRPRPVLEVGPLERVQLHQARQVEHRPVARDVAGVDLELANEQVEHLIADAVLDLEPNRVVEPAPPELELDGFEQVVGLFVLERQVGVARDPEHRPLLDDHADEQRRQMRGDQLLGGQEAPFVERDQAREHVRDLEPHEPALARLGVGDVGGDAQGEVGDVRERVAGIDRQRREHREDPLVVERATSPCDPFVPRSAHDTMRTPAAVSAGRAVDEDRLLALDQPLDTLADLDRAAGQEIARRASGRRCRQRSGPSRRRRGPGRTRRG